MVQDAAGCGALASSGGAGGRSGAATMALAGGAGGPASASSAASSNYVALGDSYTAGAGILPPSSSISPLCLQSTLNYPHLVAAEEGWNFRT